MIKTLDYFHRLNLPAAVAQLFADLDVPLNRTGEAAAALGDVLEKNYQTRFEEYDQDVFWVGQVDDNAFEGIQSSAAELSKIRGKNYDTILVFALELYRENGLLPTRTQLFDLTRAFNREFPYQPVVLVFRYGGHLMSVAVVERSDYKAKHLEGDKIGKMSLLRDVDTRKDRTHAGHQRILRDMQIPRSGKNAVTTFETLYRHWQQALNVSVLNKKFYQELSNWYFWAIHNVRFPGEPLGADDEKLKTHRANNVIRLITRLIFTWFLKEKKLVPDTLFDLEELTADHLKIASLTPDRSEGSEYYLAILQNLFFATLNQEMQERRFKTETKVFPHPDHSIKNIYRHAALFKNAGRAAELFKDIPFLNGGLFECLDDEKNNIDGFSETKAKQPSVPNFLFFQKDAPLADELNEDYGTKGKKYEVRGLINILNDYKFTIAENTPLEEEVALDPELLGRIFENLLASYNPETKTTARKQTGSFYTPREIVNYMVDESLIAYLKNKLTENYAGHLELGKTQVSLFGEQPNKKGQIALETQPNASRWKNKEEHLEQNLRLLFTPTDIQPFDDQRDVEDLIAAIDQCKILDPACGSGAFPTGILHRMVALLDKLDPKNTRWRERQIRNAERIEDPTARQEAIKAIDEAFQRNELDYGRKLFLIENCIYGVDIQPIAVQIAKLRFFISLICNQNTDDSADNRGILALPNLETKFVAANSLIGLEKATLAKEVVRDLLNEREKLHHRIFSANKGQNKKRYKEQYEKLRLRVKERLEETGWFSDDESSQFANWDPFNQNVFASFFDMQWMFTIEKGFDIVIGNPPYVNAMQLKKLIDESILKKLKEAHESAKGTIDLYVLFIEKGIKLLMNSGILCFITPNRYLSANYGIALRQYLLKQIHFIRLGDFSNVNVFDEVSTYPVVSIFKKNNIGSSYDIHIDKFTDKGGFIEKVKSSTKSSILLNAIEDNIWGFLLNDKMEITQIVMNQSIKLNSVCKINATSTAKEADDFHYLINEISGFKLINTGTIDRYCSLWGKEYLVDKGIKYLKPYLPMSLNDIGKNRMRLYGSPKIIIAKIGLTLEAFLDDQGEYASINTNCLYDFNQDVSPKYILAWLHSKLFQYVFECFFEGLKMAGGYLLYSAPNLSSMFIKKTESQSLFVHVVTILLQAKRESFPEHTTQIFERILNGMVCELYFSELMHEKEVGILAQVERDLEPYSDFDKRSETEKVAAVEELHRLWTHPDSVVRNRLALMPVRSPDVLGVILEEK